MARLTIELLGPEGNIFWILAAVQREMGKGEEFDELHKAVTSSKTYADALDEIKQRFDIEFTMNGEIME